MSMNQMRKLRVQRGAEGALPVRGVEGNGVPPGACLRLADSSLSPKEANTQQDLPGHWHRCPRVNPGCDFSF